MSKLQPDRSDTAEDFADGNTLPHLIKLVKLIQIF